MITIMFRQIKQKICIQGWPALPRHTWGSNLLSPFNALLLRGESVEPRCWLSDASGVVGVLILHQTRPGLGHCTLIPPLVAPQLHRHPSQTVFHSQIYMSTPDASYYAEESPALLITASLTYPASSSHRWDALLLAGTNSTLKMIPNLGHRRPESKDLQAQAMLYRSLAKECLTFV